jgi:hypothetical protein
METFDFYNVYETFNRVEAVAWFAIALALPFFVKADTPRRRVVIATASLTFIAFGFTDLAEAGTRGQMPPWLWIAKVACAAVLLCCRYTYLGWHRFRITDRYLLFALLCLAAMCAGVLTQRFLSVEP